MPTYDYLCNKCGCEFEQFHGFNQAPEPCECGSSDIKIVINQPPAAFVKGEPTTLGQLAESNTKNMGRYELEDRRAYQNEGKQKPKKDEECLWKLRNLGGINMFFLKLRKSFYEVFDLFLKRVWRDCFSRRVFI